MKIFEIVNESTEQQMAAVANQAVAKAKAGDIGGAADDMEKMHNSIARLDIGSGLYDFMQKTLRDFKELVKNNPNHPEAPKFVQAIKDMEAGLPAMKQAAADSRRMAVDAGAGRQDVGEVATAGGTSAGSIAVVANPKIAHSKKKPKKQKPTDNALDMKGTSIFGGPAIKR